MSIGCSWLRASAVAMVGATLVALLFSPGALARADGSPYRLWWSFPADDITAIEIDDPDLSASEFHSRWELALSLNPCSPRGMRTSSSRRSDDTDSAPREAMSPRGPVRTREIRVESLDGAGRVRTTRRCVLSIGLWRDRIGRQLVERLDDELDAHSSFVAPRKHPQMPTPPPE